MFPLIFTEVWRSDTIPIITKRSKRVNLFTKNEQKEINRARTMRELPDLSLVVGKQLGFVESDPVDSANSHGRGDANAAESDAETRLVRKSNKRKEREETAAVVEEQLEGASADGGAGTEKKRVCKEPAAVRSSSVEEGELQALEPSGAPADAAVSNPPSEGDRTDDR